MTIAALRRLGGVALLCTLTTCTPASGRAGDFAELASALEAVPGIAPRLSIGNAFRPCSEQQPPNGTILRADCPARRKARADRIAAVAREAARKDDLDAARTLAMIDLVAADERGRALDRSITSLRRLATLVDRPAPVLADLAAALIVRAERTQAPRDLLEAYETAEQALQHEPRNLAALYNRALALERYGLVDETANDWRAYLAVDSRSRWADDARRRLYALLHLPGPPTPPAADAPLSAYSAYAAADPQGARELGMDRLLGEWGEAIDAGDTARAADRLARAAALGEALERRPGGDASLADMVRSIRDASGNAAATRELARAHREYAAAIVLYDSIAYGEAEVQFGALAASADASPALQEWARTFWGTTRVLNRAAEEGEKILRERLAEVDAKRYPALTARMRWSLGNTVNRADRWEQGLGEAREAAKLFALAGERENEGGALNVVAEAHSTLGEPDSGYVAMHRALSRLRPYRASVRLHTMLTAGARQLETDGLLPAAIALQTEDIRVASHSGRPIHIIEARAARARLLAAGSSQPTEAHEDVDSAFARLPEVQDQGARRWLEADLREVEALVWRIRDPVRATRAFDSAAAFFANIPIRAFPYLVRGAEAQLSAGDAAGAMVRLERAIALLEKRRDSIRVEPRRAAVFDRALRVIDRVVMLKLASGDAHGALEYMDRARASLAAAGDFDPFPIRGVAAPPGELLLEYALVADTLLAWTVRGNNVSVWRRTVDTLELIRTVADAEAKLQRRAQEEEVRPLLASLHGWLLRPLEAMLGASGTPVVIVADGVLGSVPFAALYSARTGRYMVEDHPIRFAVSLREAQRRPVTEPASSVLLIVDPAFEPREHPLLDRLPHAREEVRRFSAGYSGAAVLDGPRATKSAVESALSRSGLAHFAGHAVFDDERPERSYLVLAAEDAAAGRISAEELAQLDLSRMRLVVLAACRTVRGAHGRAGGFAGLAGALLAAGTGGVVGSTWDVDDSLTSVLMTEFHRRYQHSRDGPGALREAQLALLRSQDPLLRTPAAWAGFRLAGR